MPLLLLAELPSSEHEHRSVPKQGHADALTERNSAVDVPKREPFIQIAVIVPGHLRGAEKPVAPVRAISLSRNPGNDHATNAAKWHKQ
jgi:hypothetical protein